VNWRDCTHCWAGKRKTSPCSGYADLATADLQAPAHQKHRQMCHLVSQSAGWKAPRRCANQPTDCIYIRECASSAGYIHTTINTVCCPLYVNITEWGVRAISRPVCVCASPINNTLRRAACNCFGSHSHTLLCVAFSLCGTTWQLSQKI